MLSLTRAEFKQEFGVPPGEFFDLRQILTEKHKLEAMQLPDPHLMRVRREYGTMTKKWREDIIYCLEVGYFIRDGRFKARIEHIIFFDDQTEQDLYRAAASHEQPNWNDN